jgi:NAD(P)H-dependent flavin oxidoreductase YrpB (nitropropane dioxygenase family)
MGGIRGRSAGAVQAAVELLTRHRVAIVVCNTPQVPALAPVIGAVRDIVAGGGATGQDAQAALSHGAEAVQIGGALLKEGPGVLARLQRELLTGHTGQESSVHGGRNPA